MQARGPLARPSRRSVVLWLEAVALGFLLLDCSLSGADLSGADLSNTNLEGTISAGPISRRRT